MRNRFLNIIHFEYEEDQIWYHCELDADFLRWHKGQKFDYIYVNDRDRIVRMYTDGVTIELSFTHIYAELSARQFSRFTSRPIDWKNECVSLMQILDNMCDIEKINIHPVVKREYLARCTNRTTSSLVKVENRTS